MGHVLKLLLVAAHVPTSVKKEFLVNTFCMELEWYSNCPNIETDLLETDQLPCQKPDNFGDDEMEVSNKTAQEIPITNFKVHGYWMWR